MEPILYPSADYPRRCWKCGSSLVLKRMKIGWGLYCSSCSRFRKFGVPVVLRGGGPMCRVDVRESGRQKRKVYL